MQLAHTRGVNFAHSMDMVTGNLPPWINTWDLAAVQIYQKPRDGWSRLKNLYIV